MTDARALTVALAALEDLHGGLTFSDEQYDVNIDDCQCQLAEAARTLRRMVAEEEPIAPPYLIEGMTKAQLEKLAKRWESAHCDAGIIGSDFYADPERVFEVVRSNRESLMRALVRAKVGRTSEVAE